MTKENKKNSGFTIAETIVAIAILIATVGSAVAVITQVTKGVSVARNRTVAANLAQEGVEIARAVRDDSWINFGNYDEPFEIGVVSCVTFAGDQITFATTTDACNDDFALHWNEVKGRYTHDTSAGPKTPFERRIVVEKIPNPVTDDTYRDPPPDVLQVRSTVSWGLGNEVVVENHLYDWR